MRAPRRAAFLLGCVLSVIAIGCGGSDRPEQTLEDLGRAISESKPGAPATVTISDHARFGWDRLVVQGPFSELTGYRLRFISGDDIVEQVNGDFRANLDCLAERRHGFMRDDARFTAVTHRYRDGGIYRVLVPLSPARAARRCRAAHGPYDE